MFQIFFQSMSHRDEFRYFFINAKEYFQHTSYMFMYQPIKRKTKFGSFWQLLAKQNVLMDNPRTNVKGPYSNIFLLIQQFRRRWLHRPHVTEIHGDNIS